MGFNHIGDLRLEGNAQVRMGFWFNNGHNDEGAIYFAANPIGTFSSRGVTSNVGWVAMVDQEKAKDFRGGLTWYFVTVRNLEPSGVECDFDGGGF
jgi:hypothetical protein